MQAFDDFGVIVMSDLILESRPCPQNIWMSARESIDFEMMRRGMDEPDRMWGTVRLMPQAFPLLNFHSGEPQVAGPDVGYTDQLPEHVSKSPRSYFPETWLWELVATGKEGKASITRNLPHTITNWIGHTICISSNYGLGIGLPVKIQSFQPFFLDYTLPYSVKRGELLRMRVSLFNYMEHSLPVKIQLIDAPGFVLQLSSDTVKYCVDPRTSIVHEYVLRPNIIGDINVTVAASVDPEYEHSCGPETVLFIQDVIVKPILVQPEGFPIETTKSAFVCPKDFSDDSSISWNLDLPDDFIADSARAYVSLVGDLLGPALDNLDNLVRLPFGCGEQNLILFAPNIHVISYLDATRGQLTNPELRKKAIRNMEKGYQRELNYRHTDGSYSAFGPHSTESGGSMWLTAFVIKTFSQARNYINIDERDLKLSVKWILKKQLENGCFPLIGRVFHKDMKGGLQDDNQSYPAALTAYVLVALLESGKSLPPSIISNALYCLEKGMPNDNHSNPYTLALSTYALALLEHPNANKSLNLLIEKSTRLHDLLWWEDKNKPSIGLSIEITAYCVLSLIKVGGDINMAMALKAIRWMSKQRNAEGGFTSTQDTVLGLEALGKYAETMNTNKTDLSVLVTAGDVDRVVRMNDENRMVLVQIKLPILPTTVEIFAEGEGCLLVQTNLKYNVASVMGSQAFDISILTEPVASGDECSMQKLTICSRYKMADEESNMAILEIDMISGFLPDKGTLHALLEDTTTRVKRVEEERNSVAIYFDKLTGDRTCLSFLLNRENIVDNAEPANIKLYDYYRQELVVIKNYTFSTTCKKIDVDIEGIDSMPNEQETTTTTRKLSSTTETTTISTSSSPTIFNSIDKKHEEIGESLERSAKSLIQNRIKKFDEKIEINNNNNNYRLDNVTIKKTTTTEKSFVDLVNRLLNKIDKPIERIPVTFTRKPPPITTEIIPSIDEVDTGSGRGPEDVGSFFIDNPSFVIIDHELETPDGIEGPPPVYVKPSFNFHLNKDDLEPQLLNPINDTDFNQSINIPLDFNITKLTDGGGGDGGGQACPICGDKIPLDINEIYCKSSHVLKIVIRKLRKARLLLDYRTEDFQKRISSNIDLSLDPKCICGPLDKPGTLALLIAARNSTGEFMDTEQNLQRINEYGKKPLDATISIYTLPNIDGTPPEIALARQSCLGLG